MPQTEHEAGGELGANIVAGFATDLHTQYMNTYTHTHTHIHASMKLKTASGSEYSKQA